MALVGPGYDDVMDGCVRALAHMTIVTARDTPTRQMDKCPDCHQTYSVHIGDRIQTMLGIRG